MKKVGTFMGMEVWEDPSLQPDQFRIVQSKPMVIIDDASVVTPGMWKRSLEAERKKS